MVAFGLGEFHEVSNSSDRLHLQFDSGGSIHLREKNIAGPTERSSRWLAAYSSSMEGPAFFDEDDVCAGNRSFATACLNRYGAFSVHF